MGGKQSNLTDNEMEDLQRIVADILAGVCAMADKHSIDRDSMLKYLADMLTAFAEVASIQDYKFNHTHSDRIRNMSDEELAEFMSCPYMKDMYDECVHGWHDYDCSKCKLEWLQSEAE